MKRRVRNLLATIVLGFIIACLILLHVGKYKQRRLTDSDLDRIEKIIDEIVFETYAEDGYSENYSFVYVIKRKRQDGTWGFSLVYKGRMNYDSCSGVDGPARTCRYVLFDCYIHADGRGTCWETAFYKGNNHPRQFPLMFFIYDFNTHTIAIQKS